MTTTLLKVSDLKVSYGGIQAVKGVDFEVREGELAAELEKPEAYASGGRATHINRELMKIHDRLPLATVEWEAANKELADFDGAATE